MTDALMRAIIVMAFSGDESRLCKQNENTEAKSSFFVEVLGDDICCRIDQIIPRIVTRNQN